MPSTHLSLHYHLIFSTKDRIAYLHRDWHDRLHAYMGGIVRDLGGVPEAVVDGVTGLLVPPSDAGALGSACVELLRDPARRAALGQAGRQFVLGNYQWRENAATMARLYGQVLACGPVESPNLIRA